MAAARAAVDADLRSVAVPGRRLPLQPAHRVVRVLHGGGVWRFGRKRQVDGDDEQTAGGEGAIHGLLGEAIFRVPGAAVEVEHGWKWTTALRLINARLQGAAGRGSP